MDRFLTTFDNRRKHNIFFVSLTRLLFSCVVCLSLSLDHPPPLTSSLMYIWNRLFEAVYSSRQSGIDYLRLSVHLGNVGTYEYFYVVLCWGGHGYMQTRRGMCVEVMGHPEGVCSLPSSICAPGIELRSSSFESSSLNHLLAPQNTFKCLVSRVQIPSYSLRTSQLSNH